MANKNMEELRGQSKEELETLCIDLRKELFELRNEVRVTKQGVEKPHLFKQKKRQIARVQTLLREQELRGNNEV